MKDPAHNFGTVAATMSGLVDMATVDIRPLKTTCGNLTMADGLDPRTRVFRIVGSDRCFILKQHLVPELYALERDNLRFLGQVAASHVPALLLSADDHRALVLEDIGDSAPTPSDPEHPEDEVTAVWRRVMVSLANVHHAAYAGRNLALSVYGGRPPRRAFPDTERLASAIDVATRHWCPHTASVGQCSGLRHGLDQVIGMLRGYRDEHHTYSIGERSAPNIRIRPDRICHIDHCCQPSYVPHADLVSLWRSPHRLCLVEEYVAERLRLDRGFDTDAFMQADRAFLLLNSLHWLAIKCGSWADDKARPSQSQVGVVQSALTNILLAADGADNLKMCELCACLRGLYFIWDTERDTPG